jgi:probable HAF family extracellular repeat protein
MGTRRRSILAAASAFAVALLGTTAVAGPAVAATVPTSTVLPTLGGCCGAATAINDDEIVGYSFTAAAEVHAVVWHLGPPVTVQELGTLGGQFSKAFAVNAVGDVVGFSTLPDNTTIHAVLWRDGQPTDLGTLGGQGSSAAGINNNGDVVGSSNIADGTSHAFLWHAGRMTDLGTLPGGDGSGASGINDDGDVAGDSYPFPGHAVVWPHGTGTAVNLGTVPGDTVSGARAINNHGDIVGFSGTTTGPQRPVRWRDGRIIDLGTLDGNQGAAFAINDHGEIAGMVVVPVPGTLGVLHAALWRHGQAVDLGPGIATAIDSRGRRLAGWVPINFSTALYWS